jgi:hypothetical protein
VVLLDVHLPGERVRLVAHLDLEAPAPVPGAAVSVRFDDSVSAVLPAR